MRRMVTLPSIGAIGVKELSSGETVPASTLGPSLGAAAVGPAPNLILPNANLITRRPQPVHGLQGYLRITCGKCRDLTNYFWRGADTLRRESVCTDMSATGIAPTCRRTSQASNQCAWASQQRVNQVRMALQITGRRHADLGVG